MSKVSVKVSIGNDLKALRNSLRDKAQELLIDSMNEAYDVAFESATGAWDDDNINYLIHPPVIDGLNARLTMDGADAYFIEYGAGNLTLPPMIAGSWSVAKGTGMYAEHGWWKHNGKYYTSIKPMRPIYNASEMVKRYIQDHAKEVFTQ